MQTERMWQPRVLTRIVCGPERCADKLTNIMAAPLGALLMQHLHKPPCKPIHASLNVVALHVIAIDVLLAALVHLLLNKGIGRVGIAMGPLALRPS